MSLRDLLGHDFGLELNISSGSGQNHDDPIVVLDSNRVDALMTEMRVLRALYKKGSVLWTTIARMFVEHNGRLLEKIEIQSKLVIDSAIRTQRENFYFDVSAAGGAEEGKSAPIIFVDEKAGLAMPYEIGWLHFDYVTDFESKSPGQGHSLAYGAPGIKATVYIYDDLRTDIGSDVMIDVGRDKFDFMFQTLQTHASSTSRSGEFAGGKALLIDTYKIDKGLSVLGFASCRGKLVKLRISLIDDPTLVDVVKQSIVSFEELVTTDSRKTLH